MSLRVRAVRGARNGSKIEAGEVTDPGRHGSPKCDTLFLRFSRRRERPLVLLIRPDEAKDIAWVLLTTILDP